MQRVADLEQAVLEKLRQLPPEKQQEVLEFIELLRQQLASSVTASKLSLQQIATMPLEERHKILAQFIPEMEHDFLTDPELTEFSALDAEDLEFDQHD